MRAEFVAGGVRQMDRNRWILIMAAVLVLVALGTYGYRTLGVGQGAEKAAAPAVASAVSVKTALVSTGPIAASLSYSGDVKAAGQVSVLPKGQGRIERLSVDVGSRVRAGDVIAQLDSASLKASSGQAEANLAAATAKLASLEAGSRVEAVRQAELAADSARARLDALRKGTRAEALDAARAQADSASANVTAARARLETVRIGATQAQWAQALATADTARANVRAAEERLAEVKAGAKASELASAQASVDAATSALSYAQDQYDKQKDSGSPESAWATRGSSLGQAAANLQAKQTAYESALAALNLLKARPLPADLQAAASTLEAYRASESAATAAVEQLRRGATKEELAAASAAVDAALGQQGAAVANLRLLEAGATEEDLRQAENAVGAAEAQLALVSNPYTASDLNQARAGVAQARAALEQAQIALGEASVLSPVDGVVSERYQSVGQLVGPTSPIVSVVSGGAELSLGVEEAQIGQVTEGQKAEITVAAYPGQTFPARVTTIAPTADPKSRTFLVKVRPEADDGRLRGGMFAQVRIVTAERAGATLVPKEALLTKGGSGSVFVLKGEAVQAKAVKTGLSSGGMVEVTSGLSAGEEVVVAGQAELRDGDKVRKN